MFAKPNIFMLRELRKSNEKAADNKWAKDVKYLANYQCEYCGKKDRIQSHHVFTRSNKSIRHYLPNGICLCAGHHKFFAHMKPIEFIEWLKGKRGLDWYDDLVVKRNIRKIKFIGDKIECCQVM
jgi:hypothetical protein